MGWLDVIRRFVFTALAGLFLTAVLSSQALAAPSFLPGVQVGTVAPAAVNEASGIAASRSNDDVLWLHNDSGDSARVFAVNTLGTLLGTYDLTGAAAVDWEDMCLGPGPIGGQDYLYLGDIGDNGDNGAVRSNITVYRTAEPSASASQSPVVANLGPHETFNLVYPDGARDAETLMSDPLTGDLYVISKREIPSRVYRAPAASLVDGATITLEFKTVLPWGLATGGDISPDGDEILVRGYFNASLWTRPTVGDLWDAFSGVETPVPLEIEPQGEAIGFDGDGWGYFSVSENANPPIYFYDRVPEPAGLSLLVLGAMGIIRRRSR